MNLLQNQCENGEKEIDEYGKMVLVQQYYELKKKYGGNEKIYKKKFYKKAKKYIIFFCILEKKYLIIDGKLKRRVCYQRYGKITTYGNYYNESAIRDLVISNVSRGSLYKREPKSLCDKMKYEYKENGDLLIVTRYAQEGKAHLRDLYFQSKNFIYSFQYDNKGLLEEIGIRKYENEKIIHSEYAKIHEWHSMFCREIHSEKYMYSNGGLREVFLEEYYFPMYDRLGEKVVSGTLTRYQYIFESDKQGYLKGYFIREWWGDRIRESDREDVLLLLSEKKQRDTGREAGRWRRPNYFIE